ncbi:DOG1-like 4 [Olea europaea subsp. europaea]|uniref:DOG1-like 4 n=1 Tax=Olea europaea subsp. europaea TaxID=158383 RepID=A0A8S0S927_OLEEU|nr:DOG1-like 4 [Olea europaea subsp. europaea]
MAGSIFRATFTSFFEKWLVSQQTHLEELHFLSESINKDEEECKDLVAKVLSHYQKYYQEKTELVNSDVFLCFSPPWLTSFERSLLWISGFKPSMVFLLVKNSVGEFLSEEQSHRIELARAEIRRGERDIEQALARIQESLAEPPIFYLMKKMGKLVDGEVTEFDTAVDDLKKSMAVIISDADDLRASTVRKIVEILSPVQSVKFLATAAEFQLQSRKLGLQKESTVANQSA